MIVIIDTFPCTRILVSFLKQTSAIPSLPKAKVPLYPSTIEPPVPGRPDMSVGRGRGDVGVVAKGDPLVPSADKGRLLLA